MHKQKQIKVLEQSVCHQGLLASAYDICRRKAAELARDNKSKAKAGLPAAIRPGSANAGAPVAEPPSSAAHDHAKFQKVPKANKGKKGKANKGQKLDASVLGFKTGSDFSVLERGDDFA